MLSVSTIVLAAFLCLGQTAKLPSSFKICKRTDPNFNACFKDAVQDALPQMITGNAELGVAPIEPVEIKSLTVSAGSGAVKVEQNYKNMLIHKFSTAIIDSSDIKYDDEKFEGTILLHMKEVIGEADYNFNGKILMLPIVGNGKCTTIFKNVKGVVKINGEVIDKKGTKYLKIHEVKVTFDPEGATFHFENLFNGDAAMGEQMNKLINENWKELFGEVKPGYEQVISTIFFNAAHAIFGKIPVNDIFPA